MKKIFLIGDSIREGYQGYVKEHLSTIAEVYYPEENCRFAQYTLRHIQDWVQAVKCHEEIDVVHWNNGLWDILRLLGDEPLSPQDFYRDTLSRIYKRIRILMPKAKVIFALSTPVVEEWYQNPKEFMRYNSDIAAYNKIAAELMEAIGAGVNDLYEITSKLPIEAWSDCTHLYTEQGTKVLGEAVVGHIKKALIL